MKITDIEERMRGLWSIAVMLPKRRVGPFKLQQQQQQQPAEICTFLFHP